jgi:hypothetical protein
LVQTDQGERAGRVQSLEPADIEHNALASRAPDLFDRCVKGRDGRSIQLAAHGQYAEPTGGKECNGQYWKISRQLADCSRVKSSSIISLIVERLDERVSIGTGRASHLASVRVWVDDPPHTDGGDRANGHAARGRPVLGGIDVSRRQNW